MNHRVVGASGAVLLGFCIATIAGCGGSSNSGGGGGGGTPPAITSFAASPSTIGVGQSSTLTAVFSGGTGVITPGNISVTSGVGASVSPSANTTYTLTVTPSSGSAITATATVTVVPAPVISSFAANPAIIEAGSSTSLTAMFSGGTGVITPGNLSITNGVAVPTPTLTTTTTYTLTVTPSTGLPVTMTATVTVDPVPTITSFTANPTTISSGSSSQLTAVFAGGTGVITPGNISVTTGVAVSVSPTTTTAYTLTVTPPVGTVNATMQTTVTVGSGANITSFTATPTEIAAGSTSHLTGYFTGGTGVITPGNIAAASGALIPVTPATTTTYTLTVTPTGGGTNATKTAIVTVDPAPVISSFTANPATIVSGNSSSLTASFTGGTGVITPGNLTVTSGTPVSVSPAVTTTYTLTVTPPVGTAVTQTVPVTVQSAISVNPASPGIAVTNQLMGMNMAVWDDFTANTTAIVNAFQGAGIAALRWPGGSTSDVYHWNGTNANPANGVQPVPSTCQGAYQNSNTNYLHFINELETAISGGYDVALTADYGTNAACTGGGDPTEAANWVKYAYANGGTVSHVTVGNENYGSWEADMHAKKNDPGTYASAVAGASGYYSLIKAQSSSTLVGVVVDANSSCCAANWDTTVLSNAAGYYDFVEYHYYPQNPGNENDTYLVQQAAQDFTSSINTIKSELNTAGKPSTPIYVGEMGSVSSNPGKQSMSITQGLFAGQMLGEMMNDGVSRATWWIGFGNCNGTAGNNSSSLYGWQNYGAYNVFSDGAGDSACPNFGSFATLSPTAQAFNLFQNVAVNGEHVLTPSVAGDTTDVRAYAATHSGGTVLVLFNLNETASEPVSVSVSGESSSAGVTEYTYSKAIYDQTQSNVWSGATTTNLGAQALPLSLTLDPWSMNVVIIK